ncbi:MAG: hypothetical protein IH861_00310 [Chloroflexi bacterium]|nr:hypothetical protein [Chloroflexota bacterium]
MGPDKRSKRLKIENLTSNTGDDDHDGGIPDDQGLANLIASGVASDIGLSPLKGFKLNLSANPGFRKVFFSAKCDCGTAAVLSIEIAGDKTTSQIKAALPSLTDSLQQQAKKFYQMSCEMHEKMRLGPMAGPRASKQELKGERWRDES